MLTGTAAPQPLADLMHAAWIRFARTGDPGWRPFDDSYPVMVFGGAGCGSSGSGLVLDPRSAERRFWAAGTNCSKRPDQAAGSERG
jgi:para-nitrobenzyl esterase